ncbi:MAG: VWA domain-containing protein [Planctomycetales bacterium]|nr:VWA domain-containing protein [Planctomycetales bacterium]
MLSAHSVMPRRRVGPSWLASALVHTALVLLTWFLFRAAPLRGVAETSERQAGIVLKEMAPDGPRYEGEESDAVTPDAASDASAGSASSAIDVAAALPSAAELPEGNSALAASSASVAGEESAQATSSQAMLGSHATGSGVSGAAHVTVFGLEGVGTRFVYVFDRSTSMEGTLLQAAKRELIQSLDSLDSVHQFAIIFFNFDLAVWDGGENRVAFADERHKRLAARFVEGIAAFGATQRKAALARALAMQPDVVFFLTDNDDPMSPADVGRAIAQAQRQGTAIQTIEFGVGPASQRENFLTRLARETGGGHVYINTLKVGR